MKTSSPPCESERLRKHWNQIAQKFRDFSLAPSTLYYLRREQELIGRFFGRLKGKKLLKLDLWNEVNNTKILFWIARRGAKVYGLDISDYLVKKARENFKKADIKAELVACDMRQIKFPDNTFDFLYTMGTIEHVSDYQRAMREIFRVLKPGGKCIVGVPNRFDLFFRPALVRFLEIFNCYPYSPERAFSMKELKELLLDNGFEIIGESGIMFMPAGLRTIDLIFWLYARPLCFLTDVLLRPFELAERRLEDFKKRGYLIACAGQKPKRKS